MNVANKVFEHQQKLAQFPPSSLVFIHNQF